MAQQTQFPALEILKIKRKMASNLRGRIRAKKLDKIPRGLKTTDKRLDVYDAIVRSYEAY